MISRRALSERLGRWVFGLMFTGMHVTFFPMHLTGLMGMPRRVYTYPENLGWEQVNLASTIGAFLIAGGVLLFIVDLIRKFRFAVHDNAGNLFGGGTLEWLPSGLYSNRSIPVVRSRYPLWDQPGLAKEVEDGRHFLPNAATGERETIVTSPELAEPQYLQRMPGPGWPHFAAAAFTAAFFLALTVKLYWPAWISGGLAIASIFWWVWELDLPMRKKTADIGAGIVVPAYASGPRSHGWWAMIVMLVVAAMIFLMLVFSYVYLWSQRPHIFPTTVAQDPMWFGLALCAVSFALVIAARRAYEASPLAAALLTLVSATAVVAAVGFDGFNWWINGVRPQADAHGALAYAFLAWQGLFVIVSAMMALYAFARLAAGLLARERPMTMESISLFLGYTAAQGVATLLVTRGFPALT
jgi:cytochrome c oxidase subunit I+III